MSRPAAKLGDRVVGTDTHIVQMPSPAGPVPTPVPLPFSGRFIGSLSSSVHIDGKPAAVDDSYALNDPPHVGPAPFAKPPTNQATVVASSQSVFIDSRAAARAGDVAMTCNDPADGPNGVVVADSTVVIGD